jgi:hypothetical protein
MRPASGSHVGMSVEAVSEHRRLFYWKSHHSGLSRHPVGYGLGVEPLFQIADSYL